MSEQPQPQAPRKVAWPLVMTREIKVRLTDKAFVFGTLLTVVVIAAFMGWQAWATSQVKDYTVVTTSQDQQMADAVAQAAPALDDKVKIKVKEVADADAAEAAVTDDDSTVWLHSGAEGWTLTSDTGADTGLSNVVTETVRTVVLEQNAAKAGTSATELQQGTQLAQDQLTGDAEKSMVATIAGYAFAMLFYISALIFGIQLANSVVEEKQSRIVEIIAASIPLRHLLAGKIMGNTVLAVAQMVLYAGVALIGLSFTDYSTYVPDLSGPVLWFLVFFVAGFLALSCLWAVAGSLASRTEELQSTSTPLTMLVMALFFGAMLLDGRWQVIGSFVPPLSAILMPMRLLNGDVPLWQPLAALGLLIAFAAFTIWIGERLYRRSLMQTSGQISIRQAWAAAE